MAGAKASLSSSKQSESVDPECFEIQIHDDGALLIWLLLHDLAAHAVQMEHLFAGSEHAIEDR